MTEPKLPAGMRRYVVARTADIPEGERLIVQAGGREIGIYNVRGRFYALLNRCPHLGGPLCRGQVVTEVTAAVPGELRGNPDKVYATCPWHNWEFDIATGKSFWNPQGLRARPFPVAVQSGETLRDAVVSGTAERVPGPYTAETVPVAVEDDYVVLSLRPAPATERKPEADSPCLPPTQPALSEEAIR